MFQILRSGIINPNAVCVIGEFGVTFDLSLIYIALLCAGNGVVVHIPDLFKEIAKNEAKGLTGIRDRLALTYDLLKSFYVSFDVFQANHLGPRAHCV